MKQIVGKIVIIMMALSVLIQPAMATVNYQQGQPPAVQAYENNPSFLLRTARTLFVQSRSAFLRAGMLENELRKQKEFQDSGMAITENRAGADLIIDIERVIFTNIFVYRVIDTQTDIVVASGKCNSLFGTVPGKITKSFIKQIKEAKKLK